MGEVTGEFTGIVVSHGTEYHSKASFENLKEESGLLWVHLPDSVIGTLIYFILCEHNEKNFEYIEVLKILFLIGFPVYFTFFLQAVYVLELYKFLPNFADDNSLCKTDIQLEIAAISVFFIFLIPSVHSIISESYIILVGDKVAFPHGMDDDKFIVQKLFSPLSKRIFCWLSIVLIEASILSSVFIVGCIFV